MFVRIKHGRTEQVLSTVPCPGCSVNRMDYQAVLFNQIRIQHSLSKETSRYLCWVHAVERNPGERVVACEEEKGNVLGEQVLEAAASAEPIKQLPAQWNCFRFPIKDSHLDIKFKCRLCQNEGALELLPQISWLLLTVPGFYVSCFPLNYLSWASVLHYLYVMSQQKWENGCSLLILPLTVSAPCSFQVSFLPLSTHLSSHLPAKQCPALLFGGWVKPASSQLRDDRRSPLYLKIRPIDLFQELYSDSDCLTNLYCRLNCVVQPPKYKFLLHALLESHAQTEQETSWRPWLFDKLFQRVTSRGFYNKAKNISNNSTTIINWALNIC